MKTEERYREKTGELLEWRRKTREKEGKWRKAKNQG